MGWWVAWVGHTVSSRMYRPPFRRSVAYGVPLASAPSGTGGTKSGTSSRRTGMPSVTVVVRFFTLFTTPGPRAYLRYINPLTFAIVLPNDLPDLAVAFYCIDVKLPDRLYGLGG